MLRPPPPSALTLIAVLATAACADTDPPVAPVAESATAVVQTDLRPDRGTIDDRWAAISQGEVPGFAGLWYDDTTREIVVAATRAEAQSAALGLAVRSALASDFPNASVRFEVVSYDFLQLRTWKTAARTLLRRPDVLYIDADEVRNRLVLGVAEGSATPQLRELMRDLAIPEAGAELVTTSRGTFESGGGRSAADGAIRSSDLTDRVRPTMGGLEVGYTTLDGPKRCTLGFNAELGGESGVYFATNSHCSLNNFSNPDNGPWSQHATSTKVGREAYDIEPQTGTFVFDGTTYDCTSRPCRFSDAILVEYDDTISAGDVEVGEIASTTGLVDGGSVTIAGRRDVVVKRDHSTLHTGLKVRMVGKKSGTTGGSITGTCVDQSIDNRQGVVDFDLLCQYRADYDSDDGDSGAPVYILHWDGTVSLIGLHFWGPPPSGVSPLFSSLEGIETDLGVALDVCIATGCATPPAPLDVEIEGPTEVPEFAECTYAADASGAYPPYTYQWFIDEDSVGVGGDLQELEIENGGADDFLLEVRVTDSQSFTEWADVLVDVSPSHPSCPPSQ